MTIEKTGVTLTVRPHGNLVSQASISFLSDLKAQEFSALRKLKVDFGLVHLIDSMGLGALIAIHNHIKPLGVTLGVMRVHPEVYKLMLTMGLDRHFEVTPL